MCGIAGFLTTRVPDPQKVIESQLLLLEHRGPDSWGFHLGSGGVVGQTRLSIIDLVSGDPPIAGENGEVGVALNGEIYNFRSLREDLVARGHRFTTKGDTEVIAHLAEDLEPVELASSLDGMFAFAVWDDRRKRLILGRDRFGKKPLYYWAENGDFVFASEIKALLVHPAVSRVLEPSVFPAYLTFGYAPSPMTFFKGVYAVPPGHVVVVDETGRPEISSYWEPPLQGPPVGMSYRDSVTEVRRLLKEAVRRRLISHVPLGAFLSGGIDSSAVVALMSELLPSPVKTFSIGFEDAQGFDERPFARTVAHLYGANHTEFVVRPDAVELIEKLVWHHDQPFGDSSAIPTYLLAELTREKVTVALSGDGGDEVFGGYERFAAAMWVDAYNKTPFAIRRVIARLLRTLPTDAARGRVGSVQRFVDRSESGLLSAYLSWLSYTTPEWRSRLVGASATDTMRVYDHVWARSEGADVLNRLLDLNIRTYLLDDLLPKTDRMSMAHGLEVRCPFLDPELASFVSRLPRSARVQGFNRKRVLKAAMADTLPAEILRRRKRGFGIPLDRWLRENLMPYVDDMLVSSSSRIKSHLDSVAVDDLVLSQRRGSPNLGHAVWAMLTLETFLRRENW